MLFKTTLLVLLILASILPLNSAVAFSDPKDPSFVDIDVKFEPSKDIATSADEYAVIGSMDMRLHLPRYDGAEKKFDLLFEVDFFSKYVSKGLPCSEGPVMQPSITAEYYGAGLSVWSNFVLNSEPDQGRFNEVDIMPYYNLKIGKFTFVPAVNFILPIRGDPASQNYMVHTIIRPQWHMAYQIGHFTPYADGFYYVYPEHSRGTYHDIGLLFHYDLMDDLELDTSVQMAIGGHKWNTPRIADVGTKINNFEFVVSLTFPINKQISLTPVFHFVTTIPDSLRNAMEEPDYEWGGLIFKYDL